MARKRFNIRSTTARFFFNEYYLELDSVPVDAAGMAVRVERLAFAIDKLKSMSRQNFGDDIDAYGTWFEAHGDDWWQFSDEENVREPTPNFRGSE